MSHFAVQRAPTGVGSSKGVLDAGAPDEVLDDEAADESSAAYAVAARSAVGRSWRSLMVPNIEFYLAEFEKCNPQPLW